MLRRHPILTILCLLMAMIVTATAVFVATFDLNHYRQELQNTLTATLKRPVHLGEAHFSLRHGPSFDIRNLQIEAAKTDQSQLRAEHLYLRLELWPLLRGRVIFAKITFVAPRLRLVLPAAGHAAPEGAPPHPDLLGLAAIRALSISDGELTVVDMGRPGHPLSMTLSDISARLKDQGSNRLWRLALDGRLRQKEGDAAVSLSGTIALPSSPVHWRDIRTHLLLTAADLAPAPLLARYATVTRPATAHGQVSLRLALDGALATGLQISAELHGQKCRLELPSLYRQPLALEKLVIRGLWSVATPEALQGEKIDLQLNGLALGGQVRLERRGEDFWLSGSLDSDELSIQNLVRLIPDEMYPQLAAKLDSHLTGGNLRLETLRFAGPIASFGSGWQHFPLTSGTATLSDAGISFGPARQLSGVGFTAILGNDKLQITNGHGSWGQTALQFNGLLSDLRQDSPTLAAAVSAQATAERLLSLIPKRLPKLKATGALPIELTLSGPINRPALSLKANLQSVRADYAGVARKAAGQAATLDFSGEVDRSGLTLTAADLTLHPFDLRAKGSWTPGSPAPFRIALDAKGIDLKTARTSIPLLAKFESRGRLELHAELTGDKGHLRQKRGMLTLRRVGLSLGKTLARLHDLNGRIRFSGDRARSIGPLRAVLGSSPLQVNATVVHFADPQATLTLHAKHMKADELIFPSDTAVLHDLAGQLGISASGIDFRHISVRLDGGTVAAVSGTLRDLHAPRIRLDITSRQANIGEVIALWHRSEKARPLPAEEPDDQVHSSLFISAHAEKGSLYGMHFQNAEGNIVSSGHGILAIYPLHFRSGEGRCTAQVLVDHTKGAPPLLRTSGRLDNFDATLLHHELLKSPGLISGKLSGDFYLEGRIGEEFLDTSVGGFNVSVRDGVLREFPTLSKVFSILNVSQILTFHLPDMAHDGMPFNKVTGTFSLRHGILSTEDLFVDSNAMNLSLVGKSDLRNGRLDYIMGVKPLRTVDKIVTNIPLAGWLLTGKEKALITAQFEIKGTDKKPDVSAIPITSVSDKVFGIFRRILGLPGHVISEAGSLLETKPKPK